jgi:hypothetical protein
MKTREEVEALVPPDSEWRNDLDVIVAGGGPAGIGAALAAALNGATTLILEGRSFFGGVAQVALWMPVNQIMRKGGKRGGVHDLFVEKVRSLGSEASVKGKEDWINQDGLDIHPEYLRLALFELFEDVGCHYRLYSPVTDALMEGDTVTGVVTTGKDGRQGFRARIVVDATGDGDVAFHAGAEMSKGREEDGIHMPVSLVFAVCNADEDRFFRFLSSSRGDFEAMIDEAEKRGFHTAAWYGFDRTTLPGAISVNNGALRGIGSLDGCKSQHLTIAERLGLLVAVDFVKLAREMKIPGLEKCLLMRTGSAVGVRDTRRIVGEYVQTVEDAREGVEFDDIVSRKYGAIDANQLFTGEMKSGFAYPYRSLLPKKIENLLMAGRCASATFMGHASGKSMGNMMGLGQAAGVAAALCCKKGVTPRKLDVKDLQDRLREMGVAL